MSLNWVMLHDQEGFVRLPNERLIYSSPPRTSVSLTPPSGAFLRSQCVDSAGTARIRRGHFTISASRAAESDIQGRGAFDFHTNFERIKERLEQAVENTSEGTRGQQNVDLSAVHLEELPAYEAPPNASQTSAAPSEPPTEPPSSRVSDAGTEPVEPPPCYEAVQSQSVADELEARLRRAS
ncbi:hypothetical protein N7499_000590 [Penicillium canescens]|uniref:Uncharacterized protein n=1 Tax=Penicillium canescens TaxID=5083 RepID=A0AAD6IH38_PENCN|nr:hypothetical protein N7460_004020 [Penicillium canescens]KAJ6100960.1 hypothetical protein N7499_000590 [Penicillium canescens]